MLWQSMLIITECARCFGTEQKLLPTDTPAKNTFCLRLVRQPSLSVIPRMSRTLQTSTRTLSHALLLKEHFIWSDANFAVGDAQSQQVYTRLGLSICLDRFARSQRKLSTRVTQSWLYKNIERLQMCHDLHTAEAPIEGNVAQPFFIATI